MELLLELFMTAFVALCISFLVAKLVSIATTGDDVAGPDLKSSGIVEEVKLNRGLKVGRTKSKKRVRFAVEEDVRKVDGFYNTGLEELGVGEKIGNEEVSDEVIVKLVTDEIVGDQSNEIVGDQSGWVENESNEIVGDQSGEVENESDEIVGDQSGEVEVKIENETRKIIVDQRGEVEEKIENETNKIVGDQGGEVEEDQGSGVEGGLNKGGEDQEDVESDDEWEGIESSELEEDFAKALDYVGDGRKEGCLLNLGSDVQMQLYGLHKVAMEGPCREAQPMALNVPARAKWNAWQRLGNMTPEAAMEQYINLLSNKDPGWMQADSTGDGKSDATKAAKPGVSEHNRSTFVDTQPNFKERKLEVKSGAKGDDLTGGSNSVNPDKE